MVEEGDGFEVVSPDREGEGAGRFSVVARWVRMVLLGIGELDGMITTYSWPVLRMTSLMLFFVANAIPLDISEGVVTLIE